MSENTLKDSIPPMTIERINQPSDKGLYIFQIIDCESSLHFFQYEPVDEATEQTVIKREVFKSSNAAYAQMISWYDDERSKGFPGYTLTKEPTRVRDFTQSLY